MDAATLGPSLAEPLLPAVFVLDWLLALLSALPTPPLCAVLEGFLLSSVPALLVAKPDCALVSSSESRFSSPPSSSPLLSLVAPVALARESACTLACDSAMTLTSETSSKLRASRASVSLMTTFTATATPTAAFLPAAVPLPVVMTELCRLASTARSPSEVPESEIGSTVSASRASMPMSARVVFSTTATAIEAPTLVPGPLAPFSAVVMASLVASAVTRKWPALPVTSWPSRISARVSTSKMLSANDAPTPTLAPSAPPVTPDGVALRKLSVALLAWRSTSPPLSVI